MLTKLITLFLSMVLAVLLAFGYAYAINYIPFIYLNFVITILFGGFIVLFVYQAVKDNKLTNKIEIVVLSLVPAVIAYYVHWAVYCSINTTGLSIDEMIEQTSSADLLTNGFQAGRSSWYFIGHPLQIVSSVKLINDEGLWSFKDVPVKGMILYIVWFIEAVLIFGSGIYMPLNLLKKNKAVSNAQHSK